ncbi:TonB-dependent receptor domain-containing protein [Sphingomonas sp. S2-65]|uniref:TonB-dependent receptor domain-containing protein n=1 Tax=Sphingomonas sp. S2-65 TaxID=2903960 RepID=UPI001F317FBD|nr:TonB-dependent receptor [Sphingomonas sp. S2-65]UYY58163.1 TonB-dependent receptor [Sphingomonas sp. S2-65]
MRRVLLGTAGVGAVICGPGAWAQEASPPAADAEPQRGQEEVVILGTRGSAVTDIAPLLTLDENNVAALGASNMDELLRAIQGSTRSADGSPPVFLLNAQRVSGYEEIGTLPPEAIEKVEVLPELAALKFGYPPTQRVVNFITKRRFNQLDLRGALGSTTRRGSLSQKGNVGLTRLRGDRRMSLTLEMRHADALLQSDRDLLPDPDVPFDAVGNVLGLSSGEVDPALSAAAGFPVTIAPVPERAEDRGTLSAYAAEANRPRLFDLGPLRTLTPDTRAVKAQAVLADRITPALAGSLTLNAEQSLDRGIAGPAPVYLNVPATNPLSPFAEPVRLARYLTEAAPLRQWQKTTTLKAGLTLRGSIARWRWDFSGAFEQKQIDGRSERGIDLAAANAALAGGADPFAPLTPALLTDRLVDVARLRTRTGEAKLVATGSPLRLPAGAVTVTATAELGRATAASATRGPNPFSLELGRTRSEGGVAIDVPISGTDALSSLGQLSANAAFRERHVSGFGQLQDASAGLAWTVASGVQLTASVKRSEAAPDLAQQSNPEVRVANVPVLDFGNGRTELVTLITGGNPDLRAEERLVRSLAVTLKPFAGREWRLSATYEATDVRNQTGSVYAITPQTEALLPDLFTRDAAGRLTQVQFRPLNFHRERIRSLNLVVSVFSQLGRPTAPNPARPGPPPPRPTLYVGAGPTYKFSDLLQLRRGTAELDLLRGDTVTGGSAPRLSGYVYGGLTHQGSGLTFDGWYSGTSRVRSGDPSADFRFGALLRLNVSAFVDLHDFAKHAKWTEKLQLRVDASNIGDARQRVRDGNGETPNRFQADYLDPIGRTVTVSLRKLF